MKNTDTTVHEGFGKRIKQIRNSLKLSQTEFAGAMDYSACYLSEIERGKKSPNVAFFEKLLTIYQINLSYLITGRGEAFLPDAEKMETVKKGPIDIIKDVSDLNYLLARSNLFRASVMAYAIKFHLENAPLIEKSMVIPEK